MSVFLTALKENWDSEIITIQNQLWSGEQREYSDEYMDDLERKLLGWDEQLGKYADKMRNKF